MRPFLLALVVAGIGLSQPAAVPQQSPGPDSVASATAGAAAVAVSPMPMKSPGRAVLLSALIPGGGQVYTGRWWKTLLIAPAELTLAWLAVREHRAATDVLRQDARVEEWKEVYARHSDRRATFLWWTGAVLAFSMADAYVSAQMYGFERQMTLTLGPTRAGITVGI